MQSEQPEVMPQPKLEGKANPLVHAKVTFPEELEPPPQSIAEGLRDHFSSNSNNKPTTPKKSFSKSSSRGMGEVVNSAIEMKSIRGVLSPRSREYNSMDPPRFGRSESSRRLHDLLSHFAEREEYMLHPTSNFSSSWTFASIIILAYISLTVPVR
jgi:hypothetical protein